MSPVFQGHQIPKINHSINIRDMVARRANACAREPHLFFDYDHHNNCEAFANLLNRVASDKMVGCRAKKPSAATPPSAASSTASRGAGPGSASRSL